MQGVVGRGMARQGVRGPDGLSTRVWEDPPETPSEIRGVAGRKALALFQEQAMRHLLHWLPLVLVTVQITITVRRRK